MTTIEVKSIPALKHIIRRLGDEADKAVERAFVDAARFGVAAALRTCAQTKPRPKAHGTYESSFIVTKIKGGAALSNSSRHAIFVEIGRRAGRMPPDAPIREWVYAKGLAKRPGGGGGGAPKEKNPREKKPRGGEGGQRAKRPRGAKRRRITDVDAFVMAVRWKIARHGVPGRFIMRRAMPAIAKRSARNVAAAIRKVLASPPK